VDRVEKHVEDAKDFAGEAKTKLYQASVYATKARKVRLELKRKIIYAH
jgi:hypothetical protein